MISAYTNIVIIASVTSAITACLDAPTKKACDNIFSDKAMSVLCCDPMKQFVNRIRACYNKQETTELTCELANCVTEEKYHISHNGKINITSCYALVDRLDDEQPLTKDMNQLIREECIEKHGYKRYVTKYDPKCDALQYVTCAYVSYLRKCPKFNKSPSMCPKLGKYVQTCDPKCDEYLAEKKSKKCN